MRLSRLILTTLIAIASACTTAVTPSAAPTTPSAAPALTTPSATPVASPTVALGATRYESTVFVSDAGSASALAISATQLFLAMNVTGAKAADTRSSIAAISLSGGTPTTLVGTEAIGVSVGGVAVFKNEPYLSREFGPTTRDSGVFRFANGQLIAIAGGPGSAPTLTQTGDGGPATAAALDRPVGIAFNAAGDLFIAESGSGRVRRVSGGVISTYAGRGACGDTVPPPSQGPASTVGLCVPELLAVSSTGDLFVAHRGSAWIARVDPVGTLSVFATNFSPSALAIDTNGALLATNGSGDSLVRFDATGKPTTIATGLGITIGLAVGPDGSIYVLNSTAPSGTLLLKITKLKPL